MSDGYAWSGEEKKETEKEELYYVCATSADSLVKIVSF